MSKTSQYPCGLTRRQFAWQMGHGVAGLAIADLLSRGGFFGTRGQTAEAADSYSIKPRAKACIFLTMNGAPSQVDTFDYKPALEKYAGQPLPPDRKYINSGGRKVGYLTPAWRKFRPGGESGLLVSDYFPHVRKHADKLCVLNSCHTDSHAHGSALVAMNTGKTLIGRPSLGSWTVYGLGTENEDLPGYVVMLDDTLVIWGGEFGRMPFSEGKDSPGRNHNPYGYSMCWHERNANVWLRDRHELALQSPPCTACHPRRR